MVIGSLVLVFFKGRIHGLMAALQGKRMDLWGTVLVALMANHQVGEKTILYLLDAVICAPGESVPIMGENARWQQALFEGDYTSSVFFSQDPVALDSVGADFLMNVPAVTSRNSALRWKSQRGKLPARGRSGGGCPLRV